MFIKDTNLAISREMIRAAYAMSKSTVIMESDKRAFSNYQQGQYFEFLEMIARVAVAFFKDTEMESSNLDWKLNHILKELLDQIIHEELIVNTYQIAEFSDSDDDY